MIKDDRDGTLWYLAPRSCRGSFKCRELSAGASQTGVVPEQYLSQVHGVVLMLLSAGSHKPWHFRNASTQSSSRSNLIPGSGFTPARWTVFTCRGWHCIYCHSVTIILFWGIFINKYMHLREHHLQARGWAVGTFLGKQLVTFSGGFSCKEINYPSSKTIQVFGPLSLSLTHTDSA